jgi:hypothetical protein
MVTPPSSFFEFNVIKYTSLNMMHLFLFLSFGVLALGLWISQSQCYLIVFGKKKLFEFK